MRPCCQEKTRGVCIQQCKHKSQYHKGQKVLKVLHRVLEPHAVWSRSSVRTKVQFMGGGMFLNQRNHSNVASRAAASDLRLILPLVWKLLSPPDVAA